ncbi:WhiB family transcriptional regulator [Streptomyces sp. NPDC050095]
MEMSWLDSAACAGEDPELFFPISTAGRSLESTRAAKQVCRGCPVTDECLEWAMSTGQTTGIWGGMSETERTARLRARAR